MLLSVRIIQLKLLGALLRNIQRREERTDQKLTSKELQRDFGNALAWYDFGARMQDMQIGRWMGVDPLAEQSRRWSPFAYCMNNPVRMIDLDGRKVQISGQYADYAVANLNLSHNFVVYTYDPESGKIISTPGSIERNAQNGTLSIQGIPTTENDVKLASAINDETVRVHVKAHTNETSTGEFVIGSFMGNKLSKDANGKTFVDAYEEMYPPALVKLSEAHDKSSGTDIGHEITESYSGGVISQLFGLAASKQVEGTPNPIYQAAHEAAIPKSGGFQYRFFDANGNMIPNGSPTPAVSGEWFIPATPTQKEQIIMKIP